MRILARRNSPLFGGPTGKALFSPGPAPVPPAMSREILAAGATVGDIPCQEGPGADDRPRRTAGGAGDAERWWKLLFERAPDAYYLSDLKGTFIDGNREAERRLGYKREELIGKNFLNLDLLAPGQMSKAAALLAQNA
jgi:PAS domain-containing protein